MTIEVMEVLFRRKRIERRTTTLSRKRSLLQIPRTRRILKLNGKRKRKRRRRLKLKPRLMLKLPTERIWKLSGKQR